MALVLQDRVSVNSTGSGTGNLVLGSAYPGYRSFSSCIPDGSIVYYTIANQAVGYDTEWEVGYGKYVLGTNTLVRNNGNVAETGVYSSSNSNAYVNFTAGTNGLQVFITYPAEQAVYQDVSGVTTFSENIISVIGANASAPTFPTTLSSFASNVPSYSQLVVQNQSNNANASADVVAYNNLGDGASYFIDMGIDSSAYNSGDYPILQANDGYIFTGGNIAGTGSATDIARLMIGTSTANSNVVIFGGSVNAGAEIATFVASTKQVIFQDGIQVTSNVTANNAQFTNFVYSGANLSNAANSTVLTTKAYVDSAVATGFVVHTPCRAATTANLSANYDNGTGGVGATLTADTNRAFTTLDGVTGWSVGQRVLVKNQTSSYENGAYTLTTVGSGATPWVLTRATDFDQAAAGEIANNAYFYITAGTTNGGSSWVLNQLAAITVGTTALPFDQFASALVYTGGQNIDITGQTISLTGIVPVANGGTNLSTYTTGDVIYANATNTLTSRAIGGTNAVLVSNGTIPDWGTVALGSSNAVSGTLGPTNGGTGQTTYTTGDILYSSATNTLSKLAGQVTTTQKFLSQTGDGAASAAPSWSTVPVASITGLAPSATTDTSNASNITSGTLPTGRISGSYTGLTGTGTLTAGTWNANVIGASYGGTGVAGTITGIPYANGIGAYTAASAADVVTLLGSTAVANATYAVTAGSAGSTTTATNLAGGAAGSIPYQSASGTTQMLATASGVLVGGSTPSYSTAPTLTGTNFSSIPNAALTNSAVTINGTSVSLGGSGTVNLANNVTFNNGGLGNASGVTFNGSSAPTISYNTIGAAPTAGSTNITSVGTLTAGTWNANAIAVAYGGTGQTTYTDGQLLIGNTTGNTLAKATLTQGTGITVTNGGGSITIANAGVTGITGTSNQIIASASTGSITLSTPQSINTTSSVQFGSFGVGTAASGTTGEIRATNNVTAYYSSDERLKENIQDIENALEIAVTIGSKTFDWTDAYLEAHGGADGYFVQKSDFGVIAQDVQKVFPVAVRTREDGTLAVDYEKLGTLAFAAIGQLLKRVEALEAK